MLQYNKGGKFNASSNPLKKIKNPKDIFDKMEN